MYWKTLDCELRRKQISDDRQCQISAWTINTGHVSQTTQINDPRTQPFKIFAVFSVTRTLLRLLDHDSFHFIRIYKTCVYKFKRLK